jgi:kynurenine formamidase
MLEIIDLSQEIYPGMPVFSGHPEVKITMHASHERWDGISGSEVVSPAVNRLEFGEHTGTHVDAISHMARQYREQSIDTMPLTMFYTEGICLDLSRKSLRELIEPADLVQALSQANLEIKRGDTILLYTDHYRRAFGNRRLAAWIRGQRRGGALVGAAGYCCFWRGNRFAGCSPCVQQRCSSYLWGAGLYAL